MGKRFSKADRKRYKRELMRKGWAVNEKLTQLLAGMNVTMSTIELPQDMLPGLKPHEKVRIFLDQIIRAQNRLETKAFGACIECGQEFPKGAVDDTPWIETCEDCLREASEMF